MEQLDDSVPIFEIQILNPYCLKVSSLFTSLCDTKITKRSLYLDLNFDILRYLEIYKGPEH